jgi:hypothetical protein
MRRYAASCIYALVILAVGQVMALAQPPASEAVSGTRQASCIVRITSDSEMLPLTKDLIDSLLSSSPVAGAAARDALDPKPGQLEEISIGFTPLTQPGPPSQRNLIGGIDVNLSEDLKPAAEEFLTSVCERLRAALRSVGDIDQQQMEKRLQEVDAELRELNERIAGIREVQRQLFDQAGQDDLSRARVEDAIRDLEDKRQAILLRLAGADARQQALAEQIAKLGQQAAEAGKNDAVATELAKVVDVREKQLAYMQQRVDSGTVNQMELADLEEHVAQARAQLAKYREDAARGAGGGVLADLNQKLAELSVDSAEDKASLAAMQSRLDDIRSRHLLELADRYEREVEMPLHMCDEMVHELTQEQFKLKQRIRAISRPEVIVIGGQ